MEQFLKIKNYDTYSISDHGNVRNDITGRILKPGSRGDYYQVLLKNESGNQKMHTVHRLVATTFLKNPENKPVVDHIDGNPKNNHLSNLRFATTAENIRNHKVSSRNTSKVTGVHFETKSKRWRVTIMINYKRIHINYFDDFEDAKNARIKAEEKYFGEFKRKLTIDVEDEK